MDRKERYENIQEMLLSALDGRQQEIWTAIPCIIQSFKADNQTCTAQPTVRVLVKNYPDAKVNGTPAFNGDFLWVTLPLLVDVPVCFPGGGGYTLTFPVTRGDEALVVFSSRCIDSWWGNGAVSNPTELRSHDLSDGIAFVGLRSTPRKLSSVSTTSTQLRTDDGSTFLDIAGGVVTSNSGQTLTTGNLIAGAGASGSFTTPTGNTVTVQDGIVTNIY